MVGIILKVMVGQVAMRKINMLKKILLLFVLCSSYQSFSMDEDVTRKSCLTALIHSAPRAKRQINAFLGASSRRLWYFCTAVHAVNCEVWNL